MYSYIDFLLLWTISFIADCQEPLNPVKTMVLRLGIDIAICIINQNFKDYLK